MENLQEYLTLRERFDKERSREKAQEENLEKELKKYDQGHVFAIDELPSILKNRVIEKVGGLEKDKLCKENYFRLYDLSWTKPSDLNFFERGLDLFFNNFGLGHAKGHTRSGGFYYVENENGIPGLRVDICDKKWSY